ncbi:MAG: class I SAM-dependent methyltransferase [Pirellulales bacterium]
MPTISRIDEPATCCDPVWETAYLAFESPEEEVRKFRRRLIRAGARDWPKSSRIVEICCGRGNGLMALARLGFDRVEGVDLSESLLSRYHGPATCYLCDCRRLPFDEGSRDIAIVHGGLHHLHLPDDVDRAVREAARVLRRGGLFVAVEPWMTPFLALVHLACRSALARRLWRKLDAMATMNEHESETYESWLRRPASIMEILSRDVETVKREVRLGKLLFVGRKRADAENASRV